jgi:hypothetical protein
MLRFEKYFTVIEEYITPILRFFLVFMFYLFIFFQNQLPLILAGGTAVYIADRRHTIGTALE